MKSVYIAGPMSGFPNFNFPAFFAAEEKLIADGWWVFNPAQKDMDDDPTIQDNATGDVTEAAAKGWDFRKAFKWDTEKVIDGDGIYMLNGWENSPGAVAEHAVARFVKKNYPEFRIMYETASTAVN
jgi:hypothetical protein